jgi:hypothetical protein
MSKKKSSKTITTRTSAKQKFAAYKTEALEFINCLRYPTSQHAFSVKSYETTPMGKKAVILSAPERERLLAITSTARMLGKTVRVSTSGSGDTATLDFSFVDSPDKPIPFSLL